MDNNTSVAEASQGPRESSEYRRSNPRTDPNGPDRPPATLRNDLVRLRSLPKKPI